MLNSSALVIAMQLPETWEVSCTKREKGTMRETGDLIPTFHLPPFWAALFSALSCAQCHSQQPISCGWVASTNLVEKSELSVQLVHIALGSHCSLT